MGRQRKTKKYAEVKRRLSHRDSRIKKSREGSEELKRSRRDNNAIIEAPRISSALFFEYNTQLGPPYKVLIDTNFINFSIQNKLELVSSMMDCLYAKCTPCVTDCVLAELEKLGPKYRLALRIAKDPRFQRLTCTHRGTYADDCIVERVKQHKCYIVATCDRDLKRRIRKIPGVPIMFITRRKYTIERMPDAFGAPN
eukprot:TRINITY_DN2245_c0_g1_i1.p1 TRINITY_DN2245_c0_g1~~TRINITY_DN2245_c0_g1_i1.p1  ORF type:complete len:197 (+),score=35.68 TRINITY_DN2245_c0_g1_i1:58-648(+)